MNRLLLKLLKNSFISVFLISGIIFFTLSLISMAIYKYDTYLKNSFAKKQPHIILKYIDENFSTNIDNEIYKIKKTLKSELVSLNSFVEKEKFVKLQKGLAIFRGKIKIVGLGLEEYPITYDFNRIDMRLIDDYNIRLTGIELFYMFKNGVVVFNRTLQKSFLDSAPSVSTKYAMFIDNKRVANVEFMGILDDLSETATLFMSRNYFNKIFHYDKNHLNGFYINIKHQKFLNNSIKLLKKEFPKAEIISWRDINKKQDTILTLFSSIAKFIEIILIILGLITLLVVFINGVITKRKQIRMLHILGVKFYQKINLLFFISVLLGELLGLFLAVVSVGFYIDVTLFIFLIITPFIALLLNFIFIKREFK